MAKPEKKENKKFFKDFKAELKKVNWPTAKQLVNNTTAVITIVLITALIVFVLDLAFEALNTYGINKLRNLVPTNTSTEEQVELDEANTTDEVNVEENENIQEVQDVEENVTNSEEQIVEE